MLDCNHVSLFIYHTTLPYLVVPLVFLHRLLDLVGRRFRGGDTEVLGQIRAFHDPVHDARMHAVLWICANDAIVVAVHAQQVKSVAALRASL